MIQLKQQLKKKFNKEDYYVNKFTIQTIHFGRILTAKIA